jgi:nitrogen regulatory protein P-II 1
MKLISSLVRPDRLDAVKKGLGNINVVGLSVVEARDHSPQWHESVVWKGHEYNLGSSLKIEIRVVVHDDDVDEVIGTIMRLARTGTEGDGHVCVMSVEHRYNIFTGLRDVS